MNKVKEFIHSSLLHKGGLVHYRLLPIITSHLIHRQAVLEHRTSLTRGVKLVSYSGPSSIHGACGGVEVTS